MTDHKFCDVHKTETGRMVPKESCRTVVVEQWMKVKGKNRLFVNKVDVCLPCLAEIIVDRAKSLKVDFEKNWKTEVWQTGSSGKKYRTLMNMDELLAHLEQEEKDKELAELRARAK